MVKKKVDARVRTLIENCTKTNHRSFFVLVGDHGKDQVSNLHYILSKSIVKSRPSVLWCYKKELGFSTHKQKRMKQIKKQMQRGLYDPNTDNPFELFISSTDIRWCYYKETQKILGSTYGMCVLQDFEAITPNILARTIETVEGGGIVVLLLRTMKSLKQLYNMSMDVHSRFRTEAHSDLTARFNERFILSLASCENCLVLDDELNVLPLSKHARNIEPCEIPVIMNEELKELKTSLEETQPIGSLINCAKTLDQAKAILTFVNAISDKTLSNTVALTASRGRGKSAALGLSLSGAVAYGYSNIFVTAPNPENLKTVFEFILKGFDALKYKEHLDYEIIQSSNPDFHKAIVRINIFREHRQTIQYIQPQDHEKLAQAELVAIDEAAAIPLPVVRKLLGPYLIFISSTINGYEGTGRSLSMKLIDKLRQQQSQVTTAALNAINNDIKGSGNQKGERKVHEERWQQQSIMASSAPFGRKLHEVSLEIPIRYAIKDPIEKWLNELLCLDIKNNNIKIMMGTPHPKDCELYAIDRDALFSYHKLSENFLQKMMALMVSSHYKNQPNDLQLMSDAPAHHLFVLLGPQAQDQGNAGQLPDILCILQVAMEGQISKACVQSQLQRGKRASGDLIPWTISQQFQDMDFAYLSGARIVRIATHPQLLSMGYGSRAIQLLTQYFQGQMSSSIPLFNDEEKNTSHDDDDDDNNNENNKNNNGGGGLLKEKIKPRKKLPPLLIPLMERPLEKLDWIGTSFGVTPSLFTFWQRQNFQFVYVRQTANELTGEHSIIMLKELKHDQNSSSFSSVCSNWSQEFVQDARKRFLSLLSFEFRHLSIALVLNMLSDKDELKEKIIIDKKINILPKGMKSEQVEIFFNPFDLKRLECYSKNLVDYYMILDLLPLISRLFFLNQFSDLSLSYLQKGIFVGLGLQHKTFDNLQEEFNLPINQMLALFNKSIRKIINCIRKIQEEGVEKEMALVLKEAAIKEKTSQKMKPTTQTLQQEQLLQQMDLQQYTIQCDEEIWEKTLKNQSPGSNIINQIHIPNKKRKDNEEVEILKENNKKSNYKKKKKIVHGKKQQH